jgi:hypothetical protein
VKHADRRMHIGYPDDAHEERRQGAVAPRTIGALTSLPAVTGWDPTGDERSWLVCDTDEAHVFRQHWPLADTSPGSPDGRRSRGGVERTDHRLTSSFPLTRCSSWSPDKTSLLRVVEARVGGSRPTACIGHPDAHRGPRPIRCPSCGFENPDGMKFCGQCGAKLGPYCPQCGFENPSGFAFCGQCGAALAGQPLASRPFCRP